MTRRRRLGCKTIPPVPQKAITLADVEAFAAYAMEHGEQRDIIISPINVARVCAGESDGDLHVVPEFAGERQHETSMGCWCGPKRDHIEPRVVVHERRAEA